MDISIRPDYREFFAENTASISLLIVTFIAIPFIEDFGNNYVQVGTLSCFSLLVILLVYRYIMLTSVVWIMADRTIFQICGISSSKTNYIELCRVIDYSETQTVLQKLWKVKTITITSTGKTNGILKIHGVKVNMAIIELIRDRVKNANKQRKYMRLQIIRLGIIIVLFANASSTSAGVIQVDPALTGAITAQMAALKQIYSKREKTQNKIIAAEGAVTVALDRMHKVEDKVLGYMANVQGAFQNLYQIKRAAELVTKEIPSNMNNVRKAVNLGGFQGTFLSTVVGSELKDMTMDMMSLYPFLEQLVTSGTYNSKEFDSNGNIIDKRNKVNLLNSAERYYICNTVVSKLENINTSLYLLAWEIQTMRWRDLFFKLDPEGWAAVMSGKNIVEGVVSDWNYNLRKYN